MEPTITSLGPEIAAMSAYVNAYLGLPVVIAIHGKAGCGKTYIAKRIMNFLAKADEGVGFPEALLRELKSLNDRKTAMIAFSDPLKEHLFAIDAVSADDLTARTKSVDYRKTLTSTADAIRAQHGPLYYAKALHARVVLMAAASFDLFVVHDLRYRHQLTVLEADSTAYQLIKITVHAPERSSSNADVAANFNFERAAEIAKHDSETDLDEWTCTKEEADKHGFIWFENDYEPISTGRTDIILE
jgi:hypothetical protein